MPIYVSFQWMTICLKSSSSSILEFYQYDDQWWIKACVWGHTCTCMHVNTFDGPTQSCFVCKLYRQASFFVFIIKKINTHTNKTNCHCSPDLFDSFVKLPHTDALDCFGLIQEWYHHHLRIWIKNCTFSIWWCIQFSRGIISIYFRYTLWWWGWGQNYSLLPFSCMYCTWCSQHNSLNMYASIYQAVGMLYKDILSVESQKGVIAIDFVQQ